MRGGIGGVESRHLGDHRSGGAGGARARGGNAQGAAGVCEEKSRAAVRSALAALAKCVRLAVPRLPALLEGAAASR